MSENFIGPVADWADLLKQAPKDAQTRKARLTIRRQLGRWRRFTGRPWSPPETLAAAIDKLDGDEPAIWLNAAVDLMAFGIESPAADGVECGARRLQASIELCEGARLGKFKLIAGTEGHEIKRSKFDHGLRLGATKDTLEIDRASSRCESDLEFDRPFERLDVVRIEPAAEFVAWLRQCCGAPQLEEQSSQSVPPQDFSAASGGLRIPTNGMNTSKQEAVRLALFDEYKNGLVPERLSWKEITDCIRDHYQQRMREIRQTDTGGPSETTVRRVLRP
jgi:hypothetical protein